MVEVPCQKIVWDVLPAIRAAIAGELIRHGVAQVDVARMLEIGPSTVSQYISGKRGYRIVFENDAKQLIDLLAADLKAGKELDLVQRTCEICRYMREGESNCSG
jgi:predicted transcriptional regulator